MKKLTLKELTEINACDPALSDFIARYGEDGEVELEQLHEDMTNTNKTEYIVWLAGNCCPYTRALIDAGADINIEDKDGWTALIWASQCGHTETAKALIDAGADINIEDRQGWTALMWASHYGHTETVKLLIDAGAGDSQ